MADVFKRFIANLTTTDLTTIFTVPTANVAATPPTPVSTFIVKTINTQEISSLIWTRKLLRLPANEPGRPYRKSVGLWLSLMVMVYALLYYLWW